MKNIPYLFFPFQTIRRVATLALLGGTLAASQAFAEMTITACAPLADQTTLTAQTFLVFDDCPASPAELPGGATVQAPEPHPNSPPPVSLCTSRLVPLSKEVMLPPFAKPLVAPDVSAPVAETPGTATGGEDKDKD